ncbi:MAG: nitroreductase family protein [Candidatus Aenigmatarchaeota archaeon]
MDLFDSIKKRRSVRKFKDREVEKEKLGLLLDSCKWAPSAGNRQPWEVYIVKDEKKKELLAKSAWGQDWIVDAPVIIVMGINKDLAESHYGERGEKLYAHQSTAAAIQNMLLTATSLDLGSCWVGAFEEKEVSEVLECPNKVRPVAMIPLGYPAENPKPPLRHEIGDFVHVDKHGGTNEWNWKGIKHYLDKLKK